MCVVLILTRIKRKVNIISDDAEFVDFIFPCPGTFVVSFVVYIKYEILYSYDLVAYNI